MGQHQHWDLGSSDKGNSTIIFNRLLLASGVLAALLHFSALNTHASEPKHGISLFGELELEANFKHFAYANPDAPKGGSITLAGFNTFDSLHFMIRKGVPASGLLMTYDSLTIRNMDEPTARYGLIAETIEVADDLSWVEFTLRPKARFHDGEPIKVEDIIYSLETFKAFGSPQVQARYKDVTHAEKTGERKVRFHLTGRKSREPMLEISGMPVIAKHYWESRDFNQTTLEPPIRSGPYRIAEVAAGQRIAYERVQDYWAKDLPVRKGHYNFDHMKWEYFRDSTVMREAFKGGVFDWNQENTSKDWALSYEFPAVEDGLILIETLRTEMPETGHNWIFNTRNPFFSDRRVREAFAHLWNFPWVNRNLLYGLRTRPVSYWEGSELGHQGMPSDSELALLEPWRRQLPAEVFEGPYVAPKGNDGSPDRAALRTALGLLSEAGWELDAGTLRNAESGAEFEFEFLLLDPAYERFAMAFSDMLSRAGITASVRIVEASQWIERVRKFDFEVTGGPHFMALTPGAEMAATYGSAAADQFYSGNISGIKSPVVDALLAEIVAARSRTELVTAVNALDRVLMWEHYLLRGWGSGGQWLAWWDKFGRPDRHPRYSDGFSETWWFDAERAANLQARGASAAD